MERQEDNDLFYVCSLIEYISRITKNTKIHTVEYIGKDKIRNIYDLATAYHSEAIDKVADEIINEANIKTGDYDIIKNCKYKVPTYWEIGRVYQRLIMMVNSNQDEYIDTLFEVLSSWIINEIDNYNSSLYYDTPEYIYECYKNGKIL